MENEELDYLVNQKAAKLVSQCHLKEKEKFEKLQKKLEKANCINEEERESEIVSRYEKKLKELSEENEHLKAINLAMTPATNIIQKYQNVIGKINQELAACKIQNKGLKHERDEMMKAWTYASKRCDSLEEERNEAVRREEFADRRCDQLQKLIQRQDVGIWIDERSSSHTTSDSNLNNTINTHQSTPKKRSNYRH